MPEKFNTPSARLKRLSESKRITIELRDEKGQESMAQSVLEQMGVQIDETARKASRAASAVRMRLRMAAKQHGVLQNRAAMQQQSFLLTQKSEYNGILLKQLRQHLRPKNLSRN
jgi:hypothetical protein